MTAADGGALRYDEGKPDFSFLPLELVADTLVKQNPSSLSMGVLSSLCSSLTLMATFARTKNNEYLKSSWAALAMAHEQGTLGLLSDEARVFTYGGKKYARINWRLGMRWSRIVASYARHVTAIITGESTDMESGLPHIGHAACNIHMLMGNVESFPDGDDL